MENAASILNRLGVCSWSLQPASADELFRKLDRVGIRNVQIALDPVRENAGGAWARFGDRCREEGVTLVSGMFGTAGEDYSTLESIRRTGGVVPDETWEENWRRVQATAPVARELGLQFLTFHAGFLPHDPSDPAYAKVSDRVARIADFFGEQGILLGLETGQETADTLLAFLERLGRPNVAVNFDPANMLLYDKGDPIAALRTLSGRVRQCHIKDAKRTRTPGAWGEEVVVGTGEVNWRAFLKTLEEIGFKGWCCIEREAGDRREEDIRAARAYLEQLVKEAS